MIWVVYAFTQKSKLHQTSPSRQMIQDISRKKIYFFTNYSAVNTIIPIIKSQRLIDCDNNQMRQDHVFSARNSLAHVKSRKRHLIRENKLYGN